MHACMDERASTITSPDRVSRRELLAAGVVAGAALLGGGAGAGCAHAGPGSAAPHREEPEEVAMGKKKILILGAGFGGLETASGLAAAARDAFEITLIDKSDSFFIGFSKIDVLFGRRTENEVRSLYRHLRADDVRFVQATITEIDTGAKMVTTTAGAFVYDYLVVALGADLAPSATPGFVESGAHEFYSMGGAVRLRPVIEQVTHGTVVIGILGAPYKCPPAPYEVAYQLHAHFVQRGVRDRITLKVVCPSPRPVPNPAVSAALERLLAERGIELVAGTAVSAIDAAGKAVVLDGRRLPYDLFIGVPVHVPPEVVRASPLGAKGFVPVSPANLETAIPGVYAVGDVSKVPAGDMAVPKAGAFAEDAARTVVSDILVREGLAAERVAFKARGACFFEIGGGEVARINADFLGGPAPVMTLDGPSRQWQADRDAFETSHRERWFDPDGAP